MVSQTVTNQIPDQNRFGNDSFINWRKIDANQVPECLYRGYGFLAVTNQIPDYTLGNDNFLIAPWYKVSGVKPKNVLMFSSDFLRVSVVDLQLFSCLKEYTLLLAESFMPIAPNEPLLVFDRSDFDISDHEFSQIRKILLVNSGFDLDNYKDKCVRRRISIRVRLNHCQSVKEYCDLLSAGKYELDQLIKVLTIHVSQFFRNRSTFEKLREDIIPQLFAAARQTGKKSLRFLSLGCSSGEEPYSLALILAEHFPAEIIETPVSIYGYDIDAGILAAARTALYNHDRLLETPLNYISRYFSEAGEQYRLSPTITGMVSFHNENIFNEHIYQSCDLLLCRNVMIYFAREQQDKALANIARAVGRDGFLVLGKSEAILGENRPHFQTVCPVERIYRLRDELK